MSRRTQFVTLCLVVGVSIVFGMVISASLYRVPPVRAEAASLLPLPAPLPVAQAVVVPSFADIAERANPAVVAIHSVEIKKAGKQPDLFEQFHYFFDPDRGFRRGRPDRDQDQEQGGEDEEERRQEGSGSGFIIRKDGYVLTNNHVVDGATKLFITLDGGERYDAVVKGKDESTDIALLKIDCPHDLPSLPLGDSDALRIGEWVMAIGNPLGDRLGDDHSVTIGVVSAKGRRLPDLNPDFTFANYLQTDAAINFGNSGGPLLNARGEVIGINTAITRNYGGMPGLIQGIGFALPINMAKDALDQLMTSGKVARGALSIGIAPITDQIQKYYDLESKKGAYIQNVNPGGPAERAGLLKGDIITGVEGRDIADTGELIRIISSHRPGETVTLQVLREQDSGALRSQSIRVKLMDRSETLRASVARGEESGEEDEEGGEKPATTAKLGFTVSEVNPTVERRLSLPKSHPDGVVITRVSQDSRAWESGLREGMIVTQIGKERVSSVADFKRAAGRMEKGQIVRVYVTYYPPPDQSEESRYIFFEAE